MTREDMKDEFVHLRDEAAALLEAYLARPLLRGVSHLVASITAAGAWLAMVLQASAAAQLVASLVYGAGLTLMLGTSALFHRVRWRPRAYLRIRKLDHSMIFVLIASSSTPFALLALDGTWRVVALVGMWSLAVAGVAIRCSVESLPRWLMVTLYVGMGWAALALAPALSNVPLPAAILVVAGGLLYTAGGVVYLLQRPNPLPRVFGFHEVFHAFTIVAAACHFAAVWPLVTGPLPGAG